MKVDCGFGLTNLGIAPMQWNDNMDEAPRDGDFLVLNYDGKIHHCGGIYENVLTKNVFYYSESSGSYLSPTAWMPLPEPPK